MSQAYDTYLREHISNVQRGWEWLDRHFPDLHTKMKGHDLWIFDKHDASKYSDDEYSAYDKYFYGNNKSFKVVQDFNYAWLHHIHNNPHHWQYWILVHDDEPEEVLDMPFWYIVEMICDWWSFSWKTGKLDEIFSWYEKHKNMKLSDKTRREVEKLLGMIRQGLEQDGTLQHSDDFLMHHGIKNQKWGVQNGPPYPLDKETSKAVKRGDNPAEDENHKAEEASGKERMKVLNDPDPHYDDEDLIDGDPHPIEKFEDLKKLPRRANMDEIRHGINHPGEKGEDELGRSYNCPKCACAFEMTERGYDVQARPAKNGSNVGDIEQYFKGGKLKLYDSGDALEQFDKASKEYEALAKQYSDFVRNTNEDSAEAKSLFGRMEEADNKAYDALDSTYKRFSDELKQQGKGARGIVVVGWIADEFDLSKRTTGYHAMNYKIEGNKVMYYDAQSYHKSLGGESPTEFMYGADPRELYFMRTDNLEVNPNIVEMVYSRGGKAA